MDKEIQNAVLVYISVFYLVFAVSIDSDGTILLLQLYGL